ncbi:hypothetical protein [Streptomyces osmaniensis]|uniref:Secreted protein n=1 Tax=Streptomyces osmaniensis TaxID=593134 RepID=A0ABP6Z2V0_9ACTN|nr:hypothetical protein KJK32_00330 [Streptomyces sp. JCM17656]
MKAVTSRSVGIAVCAALLIIGTTSPASADGHGYRNKGDGDIIVSGNNNNTAARDLIVGNNNTAGTGHVIGAEANPSIQFAIANYSSYELSIESASDCSLCTVLDTPPFPFNMPARTPTATAVAFVNTNLGLTEQAVLNLTYQVGTQSKTFQVFMSHTFLGFGVIGCADGTAELDCLPGADDRQLVIFDAGSSPSQG